MSIISYGLEVKVFVAFLAGLEGILDPVSIPPTVLHADWFVHQKMALTCQVASHW